MNDKNYTALMLMLAAILVFISIWGAAIWSEMRTTNRHLEVIIYDNSHFIKKQCFHNDN